MASTLHGAMLHTLEFTDLRLSATAYVAGTSLASHCHDLPHICRVVSGAFEEASTDGIDACRTNSVLLHAPNQYHGDLFHAPTACFNVEFDPLWMKLLGVAFSAANSRTLRNDSILALLLREMQSEFEANLLFIEGVAIAYALPILKRAAELCGQTSLWQADLAARIAAHFHRAIDLDALSEPFGLHPSYVARSFRRKTGRTLTAFLHEIRVHKAALMLLDDGNASLADIAVAVGFADQAHFTRVFKRVAGATPGEFRRRRVAFLQGQ